jgi:signal transduction histidine kinase
VPCVWRRIKLQDHGKQALAAGIAHEIRNPLTGLSLLFDDVHDKVADQPEIREVINKSAVEIDKFENLVSGLLDFSASRETTHQACKIGEIVEQLLFMVQKQFKGIGPQAEKLLTHYAWPGNVRELRNIIERICIMHNTETLKASQLPREIVSFQGMSSFIEIPESLYDIETVVFEVTCQMIQRAMKECDGNIAKASKLLGIPRGKLRYKINKYGLKS